MRRSHSFSYFLFFVIVVQYAAALPWNNAAGLVTLPLHRVQEQDDGLHPSIMLQRKINRNHRRLARMTDQQEPSTRELHENLQRRIALLNDETGHLKKRYSPRPLPITGSLTAMVSETSSTGVQPNHLLASENKLNTIEAPPVTPAGPPTAQLSFGLDIESADLGYMLKVQLGAQNKDFLLLADSGSADTWVGSDTCKSTSGNPCGNHQFLAKTASNNAGQTFSFKFTLGEVVGDVVNDKLQIGSLVLQNFLMGVANIETEDFASSSTPYDGVIGFAKVGVTQLQAPTVVDAFQTAGALKQRIVSYKLSRLADGKNDGEISFGGLDSAKFDASQVVTLNSDPSTKFWAAPMDSVSVDSVQVTGIPSRVAIFDTGTTVVSAPAADATALHTAIPGAKSDGQGGFTVPCTSTPSISLKFGGKDFAIDPRDLVGKSVTAGGADCQSGIHAGANGGPETWLLGDVFLKNVYFSTDADRNSVTLAKLQ